jgi:hypothetical protein
MAIVGKCDQCNAKFALDLTSEWVQVDYPDGRISAVQDPEPPFHFCTEDCAAKWLSQRVDSPWPDHVRMRRASVPSNEWEQ